MNFEGNAAKTNYTESPNEKSDIVKETEKLRAKNNKKMEEMGLIDNVDPQAKGKVLIDALEKKRTRKRRCKRKEGRNQ